MTHLYCPIQQLPATSAALEIAHAAEELGFRLRLHLWMCNSLKGTCGVHHCRLHSTTTHVQESNLALKCSYVEPLDLGRKESP